MQAWQTLGPRRNEIAEPQGEALKAANLVGSESCTVWDNGRREDWQLSDWRWVEKCRNGLPAQSTRDLGGEGVRGRQKKPECQRKRSDQKPVEGMG